MRFAQLSSLLAASAVFLGSGIDAATPTAWKTRTIYQIVTDRFGVPNAVTPSSCSAGTNVYCGGTFQGIIAKLDYIANMGFDAIWISPVVTNVDSPNAYHGYWAQDLYSINSHFGSASDLQALSNALHARGMYLMIDVVANHMGEQVNGNSASNNPSAYRPFNNPSHYHNFCTITDYSNQNMVEQCWLGSSQQDGLPRRQDLRRDHGGNRIGRIVKAVDVLKGQGDQQNDEKERHWKNSVRSEKYPLRSISG